MAKGPAHVSNFLFNEEHPLQLLTWMKTGNRNDRVEYLSFVSPKELSIVPRFVFE